MISTTQNEALIRVALRAERQPEWTDYANYCRLREKGLRKEAFSALERFLSDADTWSFSNRKTFVEWLCDEAYHTQAGDYGPMPDPLRQRLLFPTLLQWTKIETSPIPHRWIGIFFSGNYAGLRAGLREVDHGEYQPLERALAIDPSDQPSRIRQIELQIGSLDYCSHHLPQTFIGDPEDSLKTAEAARTNLSLVKEESVRARLSEELDRVVQLIHDWIEFTQTGETSFKEWCRAKGRQYAWVTRVYYYEPE